MRDIKAFLDSSVGGGGGGVTLAFVAFKNVALHLQLNKHSLSVAFAAGHRAD